MITLTLKIVYYDSKNKFLKIIIIIIMDKIYDSIMFVYYGQNSKPKRQVSILLTFFSNGPPILTLIPLQVQQP